MVKPNKRVMTIEQKAKAYDEALERAKYLKENTDGVGAKDVSACFEHIFPELKESENENIRKAILNYFTKCWGNCKDDICGMHVEDILAWIEKQGEQKYVVIIPKFRIGDEIKTSNEESLTITKIDEKGYWSEDLFICNFDDVDKWELVEQKPADKAEPKKNVTFYFKR